MYKNYLKIIVPVIIAIFLLGFALPYLFSANHDELVMLGMLIVVTIPAFGIFSYNNFYKTKKRKKSHAKKN